MNEQLRSELMNGVGQTEGWKEEATPCFWKSTKQYMAELIDVNLFKLARVGGPSNKHTIQSYRWQASVLQVQFPQFRKAI